MSVADIRQTLAQDFMRSLTDEKVPPLAAYFADYVKNDGSVAPDDYRLVALTPANLRWLLTTSNCLTDCMVELQCKFQQFVPDDWGGHMEKGRRDLAVIGFNILDDGVLDIQEINKTSCYLDWAQPKLDALQWECLLIRAVVDFGRSCQAKQIRLLPARRVPLGSEAPADPAERTQVQEALQQRYDASAAAMGFRYDASLERFVFDPAAG